MPIFISAPIVRKDVLISRIEASADVEFVRSGDFRIRYRGADLSGLPPGILSVPAVGAMAGAAMALGTTIEVEEIDGDFAASVEATCPHWRKWYPGFSASGFAINGRRAAHRAAATGRDIMLYSGGVDAVATLLRNRASVSDLACLWGADIPFRREDLWDLLQSTIQGTGAVDRLPLHVVRTNMRKFIAGAELSSRHVEAGKQSWWMKVQHGAALISCVAPLAWLQGARRILIAGSHSPEFSEPWGSNPVTDQMIGIGGMTVSHDSYDLTRQGKISRVIAPAVAGGERVKLAVCYQSVRENGQINCGRCEKCIRTATGFMAAGLDPAEVGLTVDPQVLSGWQAGLASGRRRLSDNEHFMWTDIQAGLGGDYAHHPPHVRAYLAWLEAFDFDVLKGKPTDRPVIEPIISD